MKLKFYLSFLTLSGLVFGMPNVNAQTYTPSNQIPTADSTLNTQVSTNGNNFDITGGLSKGQTLFHSFTDFSIPNGTAANFNPQGNRDIITRVTGISLSDINGTLNSNGANFFLINPNGIIFGPNAQLNVGRAFMASTANGINLVNGGGNAITFGTNASGDSLLRVAPNVLFNVSGLTMGGGTGQINNFGTLQTTNPNQYIGLIGGNVSLSGGQINAPGGRVELGGLSAPGTVTLGVEGNDFRAQFPTNVARGDVSFNNQSKASVDGSGSGDIAVNARNIEILGATNVALSGGIVDGSGTPETVTGDIKINATGDIVISNSAIFNDVGVNSKGTAGNIEIVAGALSLKDGALLSTSTYGQGKAGNVKVTTKDAISLTNANILSTVAGGVGQGGNIEIAAGSLSLQDGARLEASTFGQGNAGNVKVIAKDTTSILNASIRSIVGQGGVGQGGNIEIAADSLSIRDGFLVTVHSGAGDAQPSVKGDAGNVTVKVTGAIDITRKDGSISGILSYGDKGTVGNGGNITVDAGSFSLRDGAQLGASTLGQGNAGSVKVTTKGAVSLTGQQTALFSTVESGSVGNGGNIDIIAGSLSLQDGAQLGTVTREASGTQLAGQGNAGNVTVKVSGAVDITGINNGFNSSISSKVGTGTVGNGGSITIDAGSFSLRDGAKLEASTYGQGQAGNVKVTAKEAVSLAGVQTAVLSTVEAGAIGKGGNIDITAGSLSFRDGAQLLTLVRQASPTQPAGSGTAGNVTVKVSGDIDVVGRTDIFSSGIASVLETGTSGNGGNIDITAGSLSLRDGAIFEASTAGRGNAGTITVNANRVTISGKSGNKPSGLFVLSKNSAGNAGDIIVTSPQITVDSGTIDSTSTSGKGGNISIKQADLLLLRRGGNISTNAGGTAQSGGDGGNININSKLIVAIPTENSDITANAVKGRGGNINIQAQGLFGIGFRSQKTANSDITASSDFNQQGTVDIKTPGTDPGKDSTQLPNVPTDASNQISQACSASSRDNKLTVTGRGGLPPNANDPLTSDVVWQDARATNSQPAISKSITNPAKIAPPAVGWVFDGKGKVTLVAATTPGQPTRTTVVCPNVVRKITARN